MALSLGFRNWAFWDPTLLAATCCRTERDQAASSRKGKRNGGGAGLLGDNLEEQLRELIYMQVEQIPGWPLGLLLLLVIPHFLFSIQVEGRPGNESTVYGLRGRDPPHLTVRGSPLGWGGLCEGVRSSFWKSGCCRRPSKHLHL